MHFFLDKQLHVKVRLCIVKLGVVFFGGMG